MQILYKDYVYEVLEPTKPNKILSKNRIINSGTNGAKKQYYKEFTTKSGNNVKVLLNPNASLDDLSINFSVNDSYAIKDNVEIDRDILKGVLYIVKKYVSEKKPELISTNFYQDDDKGDIRNRVFTSLLLKELPEYEILDNKYNSLLLQRKK